MKIEEMEDIFLNTANFAAHALLTLVPSSGYALNPKALIKVSKDSWTSQLSYEILRSLFERQFDKTNFISPKKTPPKSPHLLGLTGFCCKRQNKFFTVRTEDKNGLSVLFLAADIITVPNKIALECMFFIQKVVKTVLFHSSNMTIACLYCTCNAWGLFLFK